MSLIQPAIWVPSQSLLCAVQQSHSELLREYVGAIIVFFVMSILGIYLLMEQALYEVLWCIDIQYDVELKKMGIKEDSVFLFNLEEERLKNPEQVLKSNICEMAENSQCISPDGYVNVEIVREDEVKLSMPIVAPFLEQFMNEKADLAAEWLSLDAEEKGLSLRAKELCEKIMPELKMKNSAKQQEVNKLQEKVNSLQTQFDELSAIDVSIKQA